MEPFGRSELRLGGAHDSLFRLRQLLQVEPSPVFFYVSFDFCRLICSLLMLQQ